jgi:hypothetical protein
MPQQPANVESPASNRRAGTRHPPRARVKVECRRGASGLGPNLANELIDLSQLGAKITAKSELQIGEEVEITLLSHALQKPVRVLANIVRAEALKNGGFCSGVRFQKPVSYAELRLLTNF